MKRHAQITSVPLTGEFFQDAPIDRTKAGEPVMIPQAMIDVDELVFRVRSTPSELDMEPGDLLIVKPRNFSHVASGQMVIVTIDERALLGYWWNKRGTRELLDIWSAVLTADKTMRLVGAVTAIVRRTA